MGLSHLLWVHIIIRDWCHCTIVRYWSHWSELLLLLHATIIYLTFKIILYSFHALHSFHSRHYLLFQLVLLLNLFHWYLSMVISLELLHLLLIINILHLLKHLQLLLLIASTRSMLRLLTMIHHGNTFHRILILYSSTVLLQLGVLSWYKIILHFNWCCQWSIVRVTDTCHLLHFSIFILLN